MQSLNSRSGSGRAVASTSTASRFRKSGFALALGATAVVAAAPLQTANAAIITNNTPLTVVAPTGTGSTLATVNVSGVAEFTIYSANDSKSGIGQSMRTSGTARTSLQFYTSSTGSQYLSKLGNSFTVGPSGTYSNNNNVDINGPLNTVGIAGFGIANNQFTPTTADVDGFFGFVFNPTGGDVAGASTLYYGWGEFVIPQSNPRSITLVRYAYDNSGAAILTPSAVPEPTSIAFLALCGGGWLALRHRRRKTVLA